VAGSIDASRNLAADARGPGRSGGRVAVGGVVVVGAVVAGGVVVAALRVAGAAVAPSRTARSARGNLFCAAVSESYFRRPNIDSRIPNCSMTGRIVLKKRAASPG